MFGGRSESGGPSSEKEGLWLDSPRGPGQPSARRPLVASDPADPCLGSVPSVELGEGLRELELPQVASREGVRPRVQCVLPCVRADCAMSLSLKSSRGNVT